MFDWKNDINKEELNKVINVLENKGLVLIPTETVYGIAADARSNEACEKIFKAKGRAQDNPLIVHVSDVNMIYKLVKNVSKIEQKLIDNFMPGPFTLILEKNNIICDVAAAGNTTIGIRMPSNSIIKEVISKSNIPLAAPSANISGRPSGTCMQDIFEELKDKVDIIIDGGKCSIGIESTVVKVIDGIPTILRPGYITEKDIENVIGQVALSNNLFKKIGENQEVESPGMKYRHYAPKTMCVLVEKSENQINKINEIISKHQNVCVVGFKEDRKYINVQKYIEMGSKNNLEQIAKNIFTLLRSIDKQNVQLAIIEGVEKQGLGLSIMNRLVRACENNVIQ